MLLLLLLLVVVVVVVVVVVLERQLLICLATPTKTPVIRKVLVCKMTLCGKGLGLKGLSMKHDRNICAPQPPPRFSAARRKPGACRRVRAQRPNKKTTDRELECRITIIDYNLP